MIIHGVFHVTFKKQKNKHMKNKNFLILAVLILVLNLPSLAQERRGHPRHFFFEYGTLKKTNDSITSGKTNSFIGLGLKSHTWVEENPIQFEYDIAYRYVQLYDYAVTKTNLNILDMYLGPRLLISKTSPYYPTASILGGGHYIFGNNLGFDIVASVGMYFNLTKPGEFRNGISLEAMYRPLTMNYNGYEVPANFGVRIGFFFQ